MSAGEEPFQRGEALWRKNFATFEDLTAARLAFEEAAAAGHADAQFVLGNIYSDGRRGMPKDVDAAIAFWKQAAKTGHRMARHSLAWAMVDGRGGVGDCKTGEAALRELADGGHTQSMVALALLYFEGGQLAKNTAEAQRYFDLVEQSGDLEQMVFIAQVYLGGISAPKKYFRAVKILRRAADMGSTDALYQLGICYSLYRGVFPAPRAAAKLFEAAGARGHAEALYMLADCYERGNGVAKNTATAINCLQRAMALGSISAATRLGEIYEFGQGVAADYATALRYYHLASDAGDESAHVHLAYMYEHGRGVSKDLARAEALYEKCSPSRLYFLANAIQRANGGKGNADTVVLHRRAAARGNGHSAFHLGLEYEYGNGPAAKDQDAALQWYNFAAEQGVDIAKDAIKRLTKEPGNWFDRLFGLR